MTAFRHHGQGRRLEQHLSRQVVRNKWRDPAHYQHIQHPLAQLSSETISVAYRNVVADAGIPPNQLTDDFRDYPRERLDRTNSDFASGGVGHMLDVQHTLSDFVEDDPCAFDEHAPAVRQFDAARRAIEQRRAQGLLHIRDRFGNRWLGQREALRRLGHAANRGDGLQRMQVLESQAAPDAIVPLHWPSPHVIAQ